MTQAFKTAWGTLITAYEAGQSATTAKPTWFQIVIPNMDSFYFIGIPSPLGFGGAEVDSVLEGTASVTLNGEPEWATALPTT